QIEVILKPRVHIAERLPPTRRVRLPQQRQHLLALLDVLDPVQSEQIGDVALLEPDPAQLHPADLGLRSANRVPGLLPAQALGQPQSTKTRSELDPAHGRTATRSLG